MRPKANPWPGSTARSFLSRTPCREISSISASARTKKTGPKDISSLFDNSPRTAIEPFCAHFGVCGGCRWQMLPYPRQLQYKQQQVEDVLRRIGKMTLPVSARSWARRKPSVTAIRSNTPFPASRFLLPHELNNPAITADERWPASTHKGLFDKVVDIDTCHLQAEPTNRLRKAVRDFGLEEA